MTKTEKKSENMLQNKAEKSVETPEKVRNIVDYVCEAFESFRKRPFCEVDALVLCELAYMKMENIVPKPSRLALQVRVGTLASDQTIEKLTGRLSRNPEEYRRMLKAMAKSPRFSSLTFDYFVDHVEPELGKQFSAVCVRIPDGSIFVAFRGTDNTLTGWRENFNMAYENTVPAQQEGVDYLNTVARFTHRKIRLGGHSKGGNLAIYAATFCEPAVQKRITDVYGFDCPGFRGDVFRSDSFKAIKDRVHNFLPQSSMIGTLLLQNTEYKVVHSSGEGGMAQHNAQTWQVENNSFVYEDELTTDARRFDIMMDRWLAPLTEDRRRTIVEAMFEIIDSTKAKNFGDVLDYIRNGELSALKAFKVINPENRKDVIGSLVGLAKAYFDAKREVK